MRLQAQQAIQTCIQCLPDGDPRQKHEELLSWIWHSVVSITTAIQVMNEPIDSCGSHGLQVEDVKRAAARAVDEQSRQMEQAMAHEQALAEVTGSRQQAQQRAEAQVQAHQPCSGWRSVYWL